MELLYSWAVSGGQLHCNGAVGILELKKRLPDMVVIVGVSVTWEMCAWKLVSAKGGFAGFLTQELVSSLLNQRPGHTS